MNAARPAARQAAAPSATASVDLKKAVAPNDAKKEPRALVPGRAHGVIHSEDLSMAQVFLRQKNICAPQGGAE